MNPSLPLAAVWAPHGLRLRTADLELRPVTESDLPTLCAILPEDLELDPSATRYAGLDDPSNRRVILAQGYWRQLGMWSPHDWSLPFAVRHRGALIGTQTLEGPDWTTERTVDSNSWLVPSVRGLGLGKQMRAAVLELAFGHLGARAAITSAVLTNAGSLGVSRSLGYVDTHRSILAHSSATLQHLRLEAPAWIASGHGRQVRVEGVGPTRAFFGLAERA